MQGGVGSNLLRSWRHYNYTYQQREQSVDGESFVVSPFCLGSCHIRHVRSQLCRTPTSFVARPWSNATFASSYVNGVFPSRCSFRFPFLIYEVTQKLNEMDETDADTSSSTPYDSVKGVAFNLGRFVALVSGLLLPVLFLFHTISLSFQKTKYFSYDAMGLVRWILSPSNTRAEMRLKWAATSKTNGMLLNACRLHFLRHAATEVLPLDQLGELAGYHSTDRATENYLLCGEHLEVAGGFFWTWRRIMNGSLFDEEGIWLNSQLIVLQACQIVFGTVVSILLFQLVDVAAQRAQESRDSLQPGLPQWYYDMFPTAQMVKGALYPAWATATVVVVLLICVYVPR